MPARRALAILTMFSTGIASSALAQPSPSVSVDWEVRNRFRLFSHEVDFEKHVEAWRQASGDASRVLASERALANESNGRGWASDTRVCMNRSTGRILTDCERVDSDGAKLTERMLNPRSHRIRFKATIADAESATCIWSFGNGFSETNIERSCALEVNTRLRNRVASNVSLSVRLSSGPSIVGPVTRVEARDVLIVGMGDSIASGEGNPNDPVNLRGDGFCYHRLGIGGDEFFLPSRGLASGVARACPLPGDDADQNALFNETAAGWLFAQCHRSLYSHQTRSALALAVEQRHIAVTYIPLGCSGAEIQDGMIGSQRARERPFQNGKEVSAFVEGQFSQLASYVGATGQLRRPDLVLLTVGANDIGFGGLVANVSVAPGAERDILGWGRQISTPSESQVLLDGKLRSNFQKLRAGLGRVLGDLTGRVIFTAYGNPAMDEQGRVCGTTRRGFDAHPAFGIDGAKLAATSAFVESKFIPKLRAYAQCAPGVGCARPATQSMVFVDQHRDTFAMHGFCATSLSEPVFDQSCFRNGTSFDGGTLEKPMACALSPAAFRAYAPRARWIRTVNDAYFTAMTHSAALPLQPFDIHDAFWGLSAVVHGGAIHPTAEGHAAMADAVLVAARRALKLLAP